MSSQAIPRITPEEYLKRERAAEFRSEYIDGQVYAMAGGTMNHARIIGNALANLRDGLRGSGCEAFSGDLRVWSEAHRIYTYPDVVAACRPYRFQDDSRDTIIDAALVIEVLSRSTANYDRGEKFRFYRSLPSFSEYLLLAQDTIRAEHHVRQPDGGWLFHELTSPDDVIDLKIIRCRLPLSSFYESVEFEV
jgi:Uma2 family endonuclease